VSGYGGIEEERSRQRAVDVEDVDEA